MKRPLFCNPQLTFFAVACLLFGFANPTMADDLATAFKRAGKYPRICASPAELLLKVHECQHNVLLSKAADDCMKRLIALREMAGPAVERVRITADDNGQAGKQAIASEKYANAKLAIEEIRAIMVREMATIEAYKLLIKPAPIEVGENPFGAPRIKESDMEKLMIQANIDDGIPCFVNTRDNLNKMTADLQTWLDQAKGAGKKSADFAKDTGTNKRKLDRSSANSGIKYDYEVRDERAKAPQTNMVETIKKDK